MDVRRWDGTRVRFQHGALRAQGAVGRPPLRQRTDATRSRPTIRRRLAVCGLAFWVLGVSSTLAEAAIRIHLSFVFVEHEIYPRQEDHRSNASLNYTLSGDSVTFESVADGVQTFHPGQTHIITGTNGTSHQNKVTFTSNSITSKNSYADYTLTTIIRTNGTDSCQAERIFRRKPGVGYIVQHRQSNGEEMHDSGYSFENMVCTIAN